MRIPYGKQFVDETDIEEVNKALKSDWITQGPKIKAFEDSLCQYTGARYAVCVSSGTAALHLACIAAGIKKDDEVITSPITFLATSNSILYCGGKPVFSDVEKETENIDPEKIKQIITDKTKAIIPVHFSGHPCRMQQLYEIAKENNLIIIEDAAHALGAKYRDTNKDDFIQIGSCTNSDMTTLSFHPVKHITTGEGGAILTNNEIFYKRLLIHRNHGIERESFINNPDGEWYYEMQLLGYNYRITDFQAALGSSQLKKITGIVKRRREIADIYNGHFSDNPYFTTPQEMDYAYSSYHLYIIRLKECHINKRSELFSKLKEAGLGVQVHYIPVYFQPFYQQLGYKKGICPNAENYYSQAITIPLYPSMRDREIDEVIEIILRETKRCLKQD